MFEKLYCDPYCPTNGVTTKNKISLPLIIGIKPNPSTGATTASYTLEVPTKVIISILDIQGKEIIQVFSGEQPDGEYNFSLPTQYLASGTYVCRIQAGNNEATAKIILTK